MSGPAWTDDRRRRQADLAACRPALGELYETAVDLLGDTTAPGRIPLLADCMREIGNRSLPDALGAVLPDRASYDKATAALATRWLDAGMPVSPLDATDDDASPAVRLSPAVAAAVMDVVVKYGLGTSPARQELRISPVADFPSSSRRRSKSTQAGSRTLRSFLIMHRPTVIPV